MPHLYRYKYLNNNELDNSPSVTNLTAEVLRNTLTNCITIQDMIVFNNVYGTVFLINDGHVIDFI